MRSCANYMLLLLVAGSLFVSPASAGWRHVLQTMAVSESSASAMATDGGSASAMAFAESTGGIAVAEAFASSEVIKDTQSVLVSVYNEIEEKADLGNCSNIIEVAETEVTAQGMAVAEVYTTTIGQVTVEGEGQACAEAAAAGEVAASSFAQATAGAIAEASGNSSEATAEAVVTAVSAGIARAFADAFSTTCTTGGFGLAEQESFARAIVRPLVEVYALAFGGASCQEAAAMSEAIGEGTSTVDDEVEVGTMSNTVSEGDTTSEATGTAMASTEVPETIDDINAVKIQNTGNICKFPFTTCCTRRFSSRDTCTCSLGNNARCNAVKIASEKEEQIAWEDESGTICKCRR